METMIKSGVTYTYNKNEIVNIINNTIDFIEIWVEKNKFRIKINKNIPKSNQPVLNIYKSKIENNWINISYNRMKKIQKYSFWIQKNPTRKRVNTFFNLLNKSFNISDCPYVMLSLKEENIQTKRKEWLKVKNEADKLLNLYKDEKKDFYKNKIIFSQK